MGQVGGSKVAFFILGLFAHFNLRMYKKKQKCIGASKQPPPLQNNKQQALFSVRSPTKIDLEANNV